MPLLFKSPLKKNIILDKKKRELFNRYQSVRVGLKSLIKNANLSFQRKQIAVKKLNSLPRNSSKVRIVNRCVLTGRGRGVFKAFRLSRIRFRELGSQGLIPGLTKKSW